MIIVKEQMKPGSRIVLYELEIGYEVFFDDNGTVKTEEFDKYFDAYNYYKKLVAKF